MGYSVEFLSQDFIPGGSVLISLPQFLKGDRLFPVHVRLVIGAEYPVDFMEEVLEQLAPLLGASLDNGNEVVQVDIYVFYGGQALIHRELFPAGVILGLWRAYIVRHSVLLCLLQWIFTCYISLGDFFVGEFGYLLCLNTKLWGAVDLPHG